MPTILTFTPLQAPKRQRVTGRGRMMHHGCEDANGTRHRQRLPLGSNGGVMYVDALCLHCGAHFVWVGDETPLPPEAGERDEA